MASDGQQYGQDNFADDQQYGDYSEQNYGDDQYQQEGMDEGGDGGTQDGTLNGTNLDVAPKSPSDEDRKLFVGGISWDTEQKDLKDYFSKFGEVTDVTIKTDPNTGKSRGFAFVTFTAEETLVNVMKNVPHNIKGKTIDPKRAKVRPGIKKIFVGGLEADYPETDIKSYFEKYGKVAQVELPFDKVKNQRRQFCFVTFDTEDACEQACKQSKQKIGTKDCDVKKATSNTPPRGGGRGGVGGWGGGPANRGGRGRGGRGRGGGNFSQPQGWGAQGGYGGAYGTQGYGYGNQGYGNYGNYDYSGYGGGYGGGYGNGYGGYDYSGWNYGQGGGYGGSTGYGQQQSSYGKAPRRGGAAGAPAAGGAGYHPYSR